MVKAIRFHETGEPEVLQYEELPLAAPGEKEVAVRIDAIGLNRAEAGFRRGKYVEQPKLPARIGYEAAGEVLAIGSGVEGLAVGDSVSVLPAFSMNSYGVYAEQAIVPASAILKRPDGMTALDGASLWMPYLTAWGALYDITGIGKGDAVIINAASSSVGLAAISLCNRVGATAIAVTRGSDKREALLQHGADAVVVSNEEDIAESVKSITDGKGARLAFDPVAGDGVLKLAEALGPQGQIIIYGNLSGNAHNTPFPYGQGMAKGLSVRAYLVFELIRDQVRRERAIAGILEGYADGSIRPVTDKVFDFNEMVEAHRYLEGSTQFGKVMVKVG